MYEENFQNWNLKYVVGSSKGWLAYATSNNGNILKQWSLFISLLWETYHQETIGCSSKFGCRKGWFCIKCNFALEHVWGWALKVDVICVTNVKICFEELSLLWRADFLLVNLISDKRDSITDSLDNL